MPPLPAGKDLTAEYAEYAEESWNRMMAGQNHGLDCRERAQRKNKQRRRRGFLTEAREGKEVTNEKKGR
jgi:hypothetical protein